MDKNEQLANLARKKAQEYLAKQEFRPALEWLQRLQPEQRPKGTEAAIYYGLCCIDIAESNMKQALEEARKAHHTDKSVYLYQKKVELLQRKIADKDPIVSQAEWERMMSVIIPAEKLAYDAYTPQVDGVYSVGSLHTYDRHSGNEWCQQVRNQKKPAVDLRERMALAHHSARILSRYIFENTDLISNVDWVVAVPPDPERYGERHNDVPHVLALGVESYLAIPFADEAVKLRFSVPDLRRLNAKERQEALSGMYECDRTEKLIGRNVLLVDDVTTHGTTFREIAKTLKEAGIVTVYAIALVHSEEDRK